MAAGTNPANNDRVTIAAVTADSCHDILAAQSLGAASQEALRFAQTAA
jgi:hypothetical protein